MAWTTPGTAVAGQVLTANFWNAQVRDQFNSLIASEYVQISGGSAVSVNTSTQTKVDPSGSTVVNPSSWSVSNNEITIPGTSKPGIYGVSASVDWDNNATGYRLLGLVLPSDLTATPIIGGPSQVAQSFTRSILSGFAVFTSDTTVCITAFQNSGGTRSIVAGEVNIRVAKIVPLG